VSGYVTVHTGVRGLLMDSLVHEHPDTVLTKLPSRRHATEQTKNKAPLADTALGGKRTFPPYHDNITFHSVHIFNFFIFQSSNLFH
jgi:hypothetical protein